MLNWMNVSKINILFTKPIKEWIKPFRYKKMSILANFLEKLIHFSQKVWVCRLIIQFFYSIIHSLQEKNNVISWDDIPEKMNMVIKKFITIITCYKLLSWIFFKNIFIIHIFVESLNV